MNNNSKYFFQEGNIELRSIESSDWEMLYKGQRDSESIRLFEPGIQGLNNESVYKEYIEKSINNPYMFAIQNNEEEYVGTASIGYKDERNGTFGLTVQVFEPYRRKGYAKDAIMILLRFGFYELRMQKVNTETIELNKASIELHKSLGFVIEGRRRSNVYTNGNFYDEILFGMTKSEFDEISNSTDD